MSKNIVLTDAMDCETWSLQKGVPLCTFDLQDLIACKFHVGGRVCMQLVT